MYFGLPTLENCKFGKLSCIQTLYSLSARPGVVGLPTTENCNLESVPSILTLYSISARPGGFGREGRAKGRELEGTKDCCAFQNALGILCGRIACWRSAKWRRKNGVFFWFGGAITRNCAIITRQLEADIFPKLVSHMVKCF